MMNHTHPISNPHGFAISPRLTAFGPMLFAGKLEEGVKVAGKLGFQAVELSLRAPTDIQPDSLRQMLQPMDVVGSEMCVDVKGLTRTKGRSLARAVVEQSANRVGGDQT